MSNNEEHHVYDDIVEHDNPLPLWWLVTFYGAILFGGFYFFHYHVFKTGPSPADELAIEQAEDLKLKMAQGKATPLGPEALLALAHDEKSVQEGATTYTQLCAACHGDKAEGKIGPNLTDKFWLHGSKPDAIYKTISTGVPEKGMPAWEGTLGPRKTQLVAAYVLSIRNKNLPGKEPQGQEEN